MWLAWLESLPYAAIASITTMHCNIVALLHLASTPKKKFVSGKRDDQSVRVLKFFLPRKTIYIFTIQNCIRNVFCISCWGYNFLQTLHVYLYVRNNTMCEVHTHTHTIHNCFSSSNIGHNNQQHTIATPNKYAAWPEHEWFITLRERIFKWHHLCWLCGIFGNASQYQEDRSDWCECICWILALGAIFISIAIRCTVVYDSRQWTAKNYMYI